MKTDKAATLAHEAKESLEALERRVSARDGPAPASTPRPPHPGTYAEKGEQKQDLGYFGGNDGDTLIIGGLRSWGR